MAGAANVIDCCVCLFLSSFPCHEREPPGVEHGDGDGDDEGEQALQHCAHAAAGRALHGGEDGERGQ